MTQLASFGEIECLDLFLFHYFLSGIKISDACWVAKDYAERFVSRSKAFYACVLFGVMYLLCFDF